MGDPKYMVVHYLVCHGKLQGAVGQSDHAWPLSVVYGQDLVYGLRQPGISISSDACTLLLKTQVSASRGVEPSLNSHSHFAADCPETVPLLLMLIPVCVTAKTCVCYTHLMYFTRICKSARRYPLTLYTTSSLEVRCKLAPFAELQLHLAFQTAHIPLLKGVQSLNTRLTNKRLSCLLPMRLPCPGSRHYL